MNSRESFTIGSRAESKRFNVNHRRSHSFSSEVSVGSFSQRNYAPSLSRSSRSSSSSSLSSITEERGPSIPLRSAQGLEHVPEGIEENQFIGNAEKEDHTGVVGAGYAAQQLIGGVARGAEIANRPIPGNPASIENVLDVAHPGTPAPSGLTNAREEAANKKEQQINTWETAGEVASTLAIAGLSLL
jgi:hypothetical protein